MTDNIPKYQVLVNWVKEHVNANDLMPGERLKSENELAAEFGMSRQTVRHALGILEQEGIIECRQGSGNYISNVALNRRSGSKNVVIISTYLNAYIFPNIIEGMEEVLSEAGYGVQIAFTHNKVENERNVLNRILTEMSVDGIIVEPTKSGLPNPNLRIYEEIIRRGIPTVFFNSYYPGVKLPHVCMDDERAGYLAAKHLLELGHKRIGAIFKSDDGQGPRRYQGYQNALLEAGVKVREENIIWIDTEDQRTIIKDDKRILRRLKGCTGCVTYNDTVAFDLETICQKHGIPIPEELSVVSIDNSELAKLCEVPLTSVVHPMNRLGEKAAENLISMIDDPLFDANYEFEPDIRVRDSAVQVREE